MREFAVVTVVLAALAGQLVAANPRDPRPRYYLGIVHQQQNKADEARTAFTGFIALAPSRYSPQVADAKQRLNALQ